ncbi:N-acetyltransferase [uncultured Capnocytophaga sp.]|uniref:GNAT family N-acetyltransferase n=1 Tax=uncultured Capnocytophaga sp. TaxID=159273 RepID=UPI002629D558|nr:N-acetyltransferase [uncultured Capnocytophaga sp.]
MIRTATPSDAPFVAPLMFQAMSEIVFKLIQREDPHESVRFLERLFMEQNNQYSYENTLVYEKDKQILGSLVYYNGAHIDPLSQSVFDFVKASYGHNIRLEKETQAGEFYIDTLSVSPKAQGKGIGSSLLLHLKEQLKGETIGLLVSMDNPQAEKLYLRMGFVYADMKMLAGAPYKHLIYQS